MIFNASNIEMKTTSTLILESMFVGELQFFETFVQSRKLVVHKVLQIVYVLS